MNNNQIIKKTENFVRAALGKEGTGHDWWHIQRVWNNAKLINSREKANWLVVSLAVLLHDVGDRKVIGKDEDDYTIAKKFLRNLNLRVSIIDDRHSPHLYFWRQQRPADP